MDDPRTIATRADRAMREGRLDAALADLAMLKRMAPQDATVELMIAFASRAKGDVSSARAAFERSIALNPHDLNARGQYASWLDDLSEYEAAVAQFDGLLALAPGHVEARIDRNLAAARTPQRAAALAALETIAAEQPGLARVWSNLAVFYREDARFADAERAARKVLEIDPQHARALRLLAQCAYDKGEAASALFARARAVDPGNRDIIIAHVGALTEEGRGEEALSLLRSALAQNPGWTEGFHNLADLRWQHTGEEDFADHYEEALQRDPAQPALWTDYAGLTSRALGQEAGLAIAMRGIKAVGDNPGVLLAAANSLSELGRQDEAEGLFRRMDLSPGSDASLGYLRFLIRAQRFEEASALGLQLASSGGGADAWPYVSIAWRKLDDPRWEWLEGNPSFVQQYELDAIKPRLGELAETLRAIHRYKHQPIAQSLRGGTQTATFLFHNQAEMIQLLKRELDEVIRAHIDRLPPPDPEHPLLGMPRDAFRYTGSWSVKLVDAGFHANHIHNRGTISSAVYVHLPETMGTAANGSQDGWLVLGEPPPELNTGLEPFRTIEPREGTLALFPSTMWHGTRPFGAGERLTCAFDVRLTRY